MSGQKCITCKFHENNATGDTPVCKYLSERQLNCMGSPHNVGYAGWIPKDEKTLHNTNIEKVCKTCKFYIKNVKKGVPVCSYLSDKRIQCIGDPSNISYTQWVAKDVPDLEDPKTTSQTQTPKSWQEILFEEEDCKRAYHYFKYNVYTESPEKQFENNKKTCSTCKHIETNNGAERPLTCIICMGDPCGLLYTEWEAIPSLNEGSSTIKVNNNEISSKRKSIKASPINEQKLDKPIPSICKTCDFHKKDLCKRTIPCTPEELYKLIHNPFSTQIAGNHYKTNKEGCPDVAEWCGLQGIEFLEGNVIKYVVRHEKKGGVEDIEKAIQYLRFIAFVKYDTIVD